MRIAHYGKSLISVFQGFFANINNIFILAGRLDTRLLFYEVLRFFRRNTCDNNKRHLNISIGHQRGI